MNDDACLRKLLTWMKKRNQRRVTDTLNNPSRRRAMLYPLA